MRLWLHPPVGTSHRKGGKQFQATILWWEGSKPTDPVTGSLLNGDSAASLDVLLEVEACELDRAVRLTSRGRPLPLLNRRAADTRDHRPRRAPEYAVLAS